MLDEIVSTLRAGDVQKLGALTTKNFREPIQTIIPWASNAFTESLIATVREEFGSDFWGFWMLGGMAGGGMGFIFDPKRKTEAQKRLQEIMSQTKRELEHALPFAMEPVVYDFAINERGTWADLLRGDGRPAAARLLCAACAALAARRSAGADQSRSARNSTSSAPPARTRPEYSGMMQTLFDRSAAARLKTQSGKQQSLGELLEQNGFDRVQHEQIRDDLKNGRIGLAQNRLPASAEIKDVHDADVLNATAPPARGTSRGGSRRAGSRRTGHRHARRRCGQPLDARCRRGEGAASVLQI